jgi:hypothetical protein
MVALFSILQSPSDAEASVSSLSIPTLMQLYQTRAIHLDPNDKQLGYTVLSYQAVEVVPPSTISDDSTLFGQKFSKTATMVNPNLGVWNCRVSNANKETALVDSLLRVPGDTTHYCFTVDISDPSKVEPVISSLQEALVRLMIQRAPSSEQTALTTTLLQLRKTTFGLAPDDDEASSKLNTAAPMEADEEVQLALMIIALIPSTVSTSTSADAYKETQSQALVFYHLRKYAATLNATLCFVSEATPEGSDTNQPTMTTEQLANVWKEWAQCNDLDDNSALFLPGNHQVDLIENVLLRNAHCPGHWDAAKDSIWKALPPTIDDREQKVENKVETGDDAWLSTLRDSVVMDAPSTTKTLPLATPKAKEDAAAASSFFENLLNS